MEDEKYPAFSSPAWTPEEEEKEEERRSVKCKVEAKGDQQQVRERKKRYFNFHLVGKKKTKISEDESL